MKEMPEKVEAQVTADELQHIVGMRVISTHVNLSFTRNKIRVIPRGTVITAITTHGKKVLFHLRCGKWNTVMVSSLGMTGRWYMSDSPRLSRLSGLLTPQDEKLLKHTHVSLTLSNGASLCYSDMRRMGSLCLTKSFSARDFNMGVDILSQYPTLSEFTKSVDSYSQGKQIVQFLMDQTVYCGIGNYLKAEILYSSKVHPATTIGDLTTEEIERLHDACFVVVQESYQKGGLTIGDFYSPEGHRGSYEPWVYGLSFDCEGREVLKSTFKDGRTTHYVLW